ncbi:dihydropteroate synthase [Dyadobacter helix]|nr:dihydropteroate synthase [Dyadobacter sp. CECT 9275]
MGILNITPDSFFGGSRAGSLQEATDKAGKMLAEGATFVDIGGYSTRPGAADISLSEESERILSIIEPLSKYFPDLIISVDTFRSEVARCAVNGGAHIINDVSGGTLDAAMLDTVGTLQVPYVLMHMRGTPGTMNKLTAYNHLTVDIINELLPKLLKLKEGGMSDILIDPGFGFAKTREQNFQLMNHLQAFHALGYPLLIGISRKGMIYKTLDSDADHALNGTTVLNTLALDRGASVLRVHDVKPAMEAVKLWMATRAIH